MGRWICLPTDMRPWILDIPNEIKALFEKPKPTSIPITSQPVDVPELWQDYQPQSGSWPNSVLAHAVVVAIIVLPFLVKSMINQPVKALTKAEVVDISPYLAELEAGKRMEAAVAAAIARLCRLFEGAAPRFAKVQLAPPLAVIRNPHPILQVEPTLLGAPQLKLPQMAQNMNVWGDPLGAVGLSPSNGPGPAAEERLR